MKRLLLIVGTGLWITSVFGNRPAAGQPPQGPAAEAASPRRLPPAQPVQAPFQLTSEEEVYLNRVLAAWQQETDKIETFNCDFTRWTYNPAFEHPEHKGKAIVVNYGDLKYAQPDKGTFRVSNVQHFSAESGQYEDAKGEHGEHWVCNGKSIWEYDHENKRVVERPIPPEMQGEAIRHSPLPFLFGSNSDDLRRRYFLRIVTPTDYAEAEIWVDAFPRFREDAANFQRAILRLNRRNYQPIAMRIYDPGDTYATYDFAGIRINDPLEQLIQFFTQPRVPFGWRKVLELPPEATADRTTG